MKRYKPVFMLIIVPFIFLNLVIVSCRKNDSRNDSALIGKWISTDMADTLEFTSDHDLYKMINGIRDHFDYSLASDSILISYSGVAMPYIYLLPAKNRFFQLNLNDLTIDFRSAYYGFSNRIILFHRQ
jgi:hypothetical protein